MNVRILGMATAAPEHEFRQHEVKAWARGLFGGAVQDFDLFLPVYDNAGIERRRLAVPLEWLSAPHGWKERSDLFVALALPLLERVAADALGRAGIRGEQVDALTVVSSTGVAVPSLDALLVERVRSLRFRRDVQRLPVFGLGCAGGVLGLARACQMARGTPGSTGLLLVVELCSLTFRVDDTSKSNLVATALFADGAAAVVVGSGRDGGPRCLDFGEHAFPDSLDVMGWHVEDDGLGVLFSRDIPAIVKRDLRAPIDRFLRRSGRSLRDVARFALHPGGTKVLAALEATLGLEPCALDAARSVLRDHGNMSAPTALFVLERILRGSNGPDHERAEDEPAPLCLVSALGPGFTAAFGLIG